MEPIFGAMASIRCLLSTLYYCLVGTIKPKRALSRSFIDQNYHAWSERLLRISKVSCQIQGQMPADEQTTLVMCSHGSLMDIPISVYALKGHIRMMAKAELRRIPLFGAVMEKIGCVIINRSNPRQAQQQLDQAAQQLQDQRIWCAPEGTRNDGQTLLPFKKGVFRLAKDARARIVPMVIIGADQVLPRKSWRIRRKQTVTVVIADAIPADEVQRLSHAELMALTRERMETNHDR